MSLTSLLVTSMLQHAPVKRFNECFIHIKRMRFLPDRIWSNGSKIHLNPPCEERCTHYSNVCLNRNTSIVKRHQFSTNTASQPTPLLQPNTVPTCAELQITEYLKTVTQCERSPAFGVSPSNRQIWWSRNSEEMALRCSLFSLDS